MSEVRYTVAWICALHIEMAAAQAMLDEIHESPPRASEDINTYTLGSIRQHNIVIACLPVSQYGTVNAATVLGNLLRTFPTIRIGLMVGIGGGVPSPSVDLRLGDVVVGTRVMPYDLSKVTEDAVIERIDTPKVLHPRLGTLVSSLRSKHDLDGSRIEAILDKMTQKYPKYQYPGLPDRLFQASYDHESTSSTCDCCDPSKLVSRRVRFTSTNQPEIFYGAIASGNQVMKHGTSRDQYARNLNGIICFEMEVAGLMDLLPCLPIRGICDYSDSHKNKEWQRYAAATAAAYARELLEVMPAEQLPSGLVSTTLKPVKEKKPGTRNDRRAMLFKSLKFAQIDYRKTAIKDNHAKTCQWLLSLPMYQRWLDYGEAQHHQGFLWIKGKPGVGKSTMMKYIYLQMRNKDQRQKVLTASFFFNARGEYLETSILGLYRSLLHQLLEGFPSLQHVFDNPDVVPRSFTVNQSIHLTALKKLLRNAIMDLGSREFTCYIDALDECDEQQVADMVYFFEELADLTTKNGIRFRVCFSSRHYPYIDVRVGMQLILEDELGHLDDLTHYIKGNLRIKDFKALRGASFRDCGEIKRRISLGRACH